MGLVTHSACAGQVSMSIAPTGQDASKERLSKICRLRYGHREIYGNQLKAKLLPNRCQTWP